MASRTLICTREYTYRCCMKRTYHQTSNRRPVLICCGTETLAPGYPSVGPKLLSSENPSKIKGFYRVYKHTLKKFNFPKNIPNVFVNSNKRWRREPT